MDTTENQASLGLRQALKVVRRRAWVIGLCFVLATFAAFGLSKAETKEYTATAALLFRNASVAQQASGVQAVTQVDPQGQRDTNLELVQLADTVSQRTADALRAGITQKQIKSAVTATAQTESDIVSVSATWTSPAVAARIANGFANAFVQQQSQNDQAAIQDGIDLVRQQYVGLTRVERLTTEGQSLLDRIESLKVLKAMQTNTQIVQAATVPSSPSSPKVARNTIIGALLGLLLGFGFAFLLEHFDRRLREPGDVEDAFGLPLLGIVPHGPTDDLAGGRRTARIGLEPFRMLRAHLRYFNVDRELRTVLVTSAQPAEGKTTIARSLAAAAASMGMRTLLIEADLRRPTLASVLGLAPSLGLSGALVASGSLEASLEEIIQQVDVEARTNGNAPGHLLDVLAAGALPPNPTELLESHAMEKLLAWARDRYQLVVMDTAPLSAVADAIPLMKRVDGVIVVSRLGLSTRDASERLRERLNNLGAPLLGVVVNDARSRVGEYYGYGYGYGEGYAADGQSGVAPTATPVVETEGALSAADSSMQES